MTTAFSVPYLNIRFLNKISTLPSRSEDSFLYVRSPPVSGFVCQVPSAGFILTLTPRAWSRRWSLEQNPFLEKEGPGNIGV